jgi:ABC-type nitrate/sulfonate/bicarbonate transport system substrate-binding protein
MAVKVKASYIFLIFLITFVDAAGALLTFYVSRTQEAPRLRVGHGGGNLVAALYLASEREDWEKGFDAAKFGSTSDIGYALLSGGLDAGFVEIEKVKSLEKLAGFENLTGMGRITFPYGATLVLRKGLNRRLGELKGVKIAVSSPECVLLKAFEKDAERLNADLSGVSYEVMPFDAMIPALESGVADAAVIKGAAAVIALRQGHSILYQNWDVQPGDECCPAIVDQAVQVLLVRKERGAEGAALADRLLLAETEGPDALRLAVARKTAIPFELLEGQPVPEFDRADDSLVALLTEFLDEDGNHVDPDGDED